MFNLTFYAMPLFFRHQKDSGSWSIYKGENFFNENCILDLKFNDYHSCGVLDFTCFKKMNYVWVKIVFMSDNKSCIFEMQMASHADHLIELFIDNFLPSYIHE